MHIVIAVVVAFLLGACGRQPVQAPAQQQAPSFRPAEVLLASYPLLPKGAMTGEQMEKMKLRPEKLVAPLQVWNYYRGIKGWRLETLPAGRTLVAVDATGRPWYKVDCSNRLYVPPACPTCPPAGAGAGGAGAGQAAGGSVDGTTSAKWAWPSLGRFPLWLLPFLALPFIIWGLGRWLEGRRRGPAGRHVPQGPPRGANLLEGPLFPVLEREDAASGATVAPPAGVSGTALGGVGRQGGPPGTANAARAGMAVGGAAPSAAAPGAAPAVPAAAPATAASASAPGAPASEPSPTAAPPTPAPPALTLGATVAALARQGIMDIAQIKVNPDGSISFWATARG